MTTLLALDHFRKLMGFNPWHFWGFADQDGLLPTSSCNPVLLEEAWQGNDAPGRQDIRDAIQIAEDNFLSYTHCAPLARYTEDVVRWPRLADVRMLRYGPVGADARWLELRLPERYIVAAGVEAFSTIALGATVLYTDLDNDGYAETATIGPIATTVTDAKEIAVYVTTIDRFSDLTLSDEWRIRPLQITISGGFVTIRGGAWLFARPVLHEGVSPQAIDPGVLDNFIQSVDVYRRYTDGTSTSVTSSQAVIEWETRPCDGWWCNCSSSTPNYGGSVYDPAASAQAVGRVGIRNATLGQIVAADAIYDSTTGTWSAGCCPWNDEPDRVRVRYLAGLAPDAYGEMQESVRVTIARYAAAELIKEVCGCAEANRRLSYWQRDLTLTGNDKEIYNAPQASLNNPLGTRRGHVYAWGDMLLLGQRTNVGIRI